MSQIWTLARRELRAQLVSPVAWCVGAGYLLLAGFFFFNLLSQYSMMLQRYGLYAQLYQNPALADAANLNRIVVGGLYRNLLVILLFIMPALTMRSFADERRHGTDELLLTSPVTQGQIVAGKFLGVFGVVLLLVLGSAGYLGILVLYGDPEPGLISTGLLGLLLVSMALTALGLAVSTATDSQVVASVGSFVLFLMLFVLDWPADKVGSGLGAVLEAVALPPHFENFSRGLITGPDVVYYLGLTAVGLVIARAVIASQRWR